MNEIQSAVTTAAADDMPRELQAMLTAFPDLTFVLDPEGRILSFRCGQIAETKLYLKPSEFLGRTIKDVLPPIASHRIEQALRAVQDGQSIGQAEYSLLQDDGENFYEARLLQIDDDRIFAVIRDMTASKRAELERDKLLLAEQSARAAAELAQLRASFLAEASTALAASLDFEATLKSIGHLAIPYLADWCTIDLLQGGEIRRVVAHRDPARSDQVRRLESMVPDLSMDIGIASVLKSGKAKIYSAIDPRSLPIATRNEEHRSLVLELGIRSSMTVPMKLHGKVLGALTFISINNSYRYGTNELELAEELAWRSALAADHAALYEKAQRAIRAREDILAVVSHDLKNPLSAIYMNAKLILKRLSSEGPKLDQMKRQALLIQQSTERMHHLIRDLLDQSKIEMGRFNIERKSFILNEVISEAVEMLKPLAAQKGIRLESRPLRERYVVFCDKERMLQVLSNVIGNAIKFSGPGGEIIVSVILDGEEATISVKDTGPGISPEHLPHIFDRYWQPRLTALQGTGLGLAIAKGIVEAHGGRIWAESRPGAGSTFYFTLGASVQPASARHRAQ